MTAYVQSKPRFIACALSVPSFSLGSISSATLTKSSRLPSWACNALTSFCCLRQLEHHTAIVSTNTTLPFKSASLKLFPVFTSVNLALNHAGAAIASWPVMASAVGIASAVGASFFIIASAVGVALAIIASAVGASLFIMASGLAAGALHAVTTITTKLDFIHLR